MSATIPFVDLGLQYKEHRKVFQEALEEVCTRGSYVLGPQVARFEENFARYLRAEACVAVASGTDALKLSLWALGICLGDEVLTPANTFIATALAVSSLGAVPVMVDVDPQTFLLDLTDAERKVSPACKAVIPVHLYGQAADMDAVTAFAQRHGLLVVEDACQSHGAQWRGRCSGTMGRTGCFSFYPAKNLGAFGDGGMICTNDLQVAQHFRLLRNYGSTEKYRHQIIGTNSRLDSLQAAVLDKKLPFLDGWNARRFQAACLYRDLLAGMDEVRAPLFDADDPARHVFHLFVITCRDRDGLKDYLQGAGVECGIHYPVPVHLHEAYRGLQRNLGMAPVAEELSGRILSLPMFPEITPEQITIVVDRIKEFYAR
ncbi:MAG: DegT/DnrJ/EryC1/StrS family aminotransferase [Desulfarculus sp.]|jgi:dTDP-4-amino-4,6-dideoxygalactose transaminase|nr:MAG: DegT/DnrJ/EryC1/StrS family aminotransferase [Desulfarculus sp.]